MIQNWKLICFSIYILSFNNYIQHHLKGIAIAITSCVFLKKSTASWSTWTPGQIEVFEGSIVIVWSPKASVLTMT